MRSKTIRHISVFLIVAAVLSTVGCSDKNSPESIADDACSCLLNSGFSMTFNRKSANQDNMPECVQDVSDRLHDTMEPMNDKEKATFTRELLKSLLDTGCVDFMIKQMGHERVMSFIFNWLGR